MQAVLKFNLPEEKEEFILSSKATDLYLAIWDLDNKLRNIVKYECDSLSLEVVETYVNVRNLIRDSLEARGCNLDMLS